MGFYMIRFPPQSSHSADHRGVTVPAGGCVKSPEY